jgi:GNAT superfamily N-acetyltransferase
VTSDSTAISPAGPDRLELLASVFGRAFVDEPMMRWPMGEPRDPVERFTRSFSLFLELGLELGVVWEVGAALGAAVWFPPDYEEDWGHHPWNQPRIHALTPDGGARYDAFWHWVEDHTPNEPLWLLDSIAVDPEVQGRGYGRELIRFGLARAQADGVGAYLSTGTAHNVGIYERCGFRVVEEATAPDDGPRIWFMRWDP